MDTASVVRLMSLIPERALRAPTGGVFVAEGKSERVVLLARFLHWLGPLDALSKEDQQLLGVRSSGGKSMADEGDDADGDEPLRPQEEAGTQIAV